MASIDGRGIPIGTGGAALLLSEASSTACSEILPDGSRLDLAPKSRIALMSQLDDQLSIDEVAGTVRTRANQALDLLSLQSAGSYLLASSDAPYLCWSGGAAPTLRIFTEVTSTMRLSASAVAIVDGKVQPPPTPPAYRWHESMRYFRMAQTTPDLFDSFRNIYLALESVLSEIEPMPVTATGAPADGEGRWLRRALTKAAQLLEPANLDAWLSAPTPPADQIDVLMAELYRGTRNLLFHGKKSLSFALPQEDANRQHVTQALQRYSRLYIALADKVFHVRFMSSWISPAAVASLAEGLFARSVVGISERTFPTISDLEGADLNSFVPMNTTRVGQTSDGRHAMRGTLPVQSLPPNTVIRSAGLQGTDGVAMVSEDLPGELILDGICSVEHQLSFHAFSHGLKTQFES